MEQGQILPGKNPDVYCMTMFSTYMNILSSYEPSQCKWYG